MAKYFGTIGYALTTETAPGVWEEQIIEKQYYGDVLQYSKRYQTAEQVNDNIDISKRISILADPYALQNFIYIRYVTWMGIKWKVSSIDVEYPRLVLSIGGVYTVETED